MPKAEVVGYVSASGVKYQAEGRGALTTFQHMAGNVTIAHINLLAKTLRSECGPRSTHPRNMVMKSTSS